MLFGAGHPVAVKPCRHPLWKMHASHRASSNIFGVENAKVGGHCGKVGGIHHDVCAKFTWSSDWLQADDQLIKPLVKASAEKYAAEKKLTRRAPADCQS